MAYCYAPQKPGLTNMGALLRAVQDAPPAPGSNEATFRGSGYFAEV